MFNKYLIGLSDVVKDKALSKSEDLGFSDRLTVGWQTVLLGMAIVFGVLIILWLTLEVLGKGFSAKDKKASKKKPAETVPEVPEVIPENSDDAAVVAAITAAINVLLSEEAAANAAKSPAFRIVSFKRQNGSAHWNR